MRWVLWQVIGFLSFSLAFGQETDLSKFDTYFQALKTLEHQEALTQLSTIEDTLYSQPLNTFAQLTYQGFSGSPENFKA
ncbi:MAG: hypothetical protein VX319_01590, partial [Bacteroidota bacterium]|nr:hypothetical protein [Bacteroidota bacterium]